MARLEVLAEEQIRICKKVGINPEGFGLRFMDDNKMVLKHFVTGFEVLICKEGIKKW